MKTEHMPTVDRLRELLVGKSITSARLSDESPEKYTLGPTGYLTLSDGTIVKVWGNDGGCACSAGCYPLAHLDACENVITNVEVEERPDGDGMEQPCRTCGEMHCWKDDHDNEGHYRIFVIADAQRVNVASFEGSDGNGYYGTGFWLQVVGDEE